MIIQFEFKAKKSWFKITWLCIFSLKNTVIIVIVYPKDYFSLFIYFITFIISMIIVLLLIYIGLRVKNKNIDKRKEVQPRNNFRRAMLRERYNNS